VRRVLAIALVAVALASGARASQPIPTPLNEDDDDPKCARGECRPPRPPSVDEDDPKLARGLRLRRPTPRFQLSYRYLSIADPYGGGLPMHLVEATGFPVSGIFRLGLSLSAGGAARYSAWMFDVGLSAGVQYPWRVTPFLDVRFAVGVIGADILDHKVVSYQYRPTIEAGAEFFVAGRFHLSAAVGWSHPVYAGVDANVIQQMINAGLKPKYDVIDLHYDTVTARVGLGF
jgi:hypothetical protein